MGEIKILFFLLTCSGNHYRFRAKDKAMQDRTSLTQAN